MKNEVLFLVYVVKLHLIKAVAQSTRTSATTRSSGETAFHYCSIKTAKSSTCNQQIARGSVSHKTQE